MCKKKVSADNLTTSELTLEDMKQGHERAIKDFWPKLARIAASYERSMALQEELQQEMALAIWQALGKFRGDSNIQTYMYRIAHNVAVSHVKKQMKELKTTHEYTDVPSRDSLEKSAQTNQQLEQLMDAIRELPIGQRQLVTLSLEGVKQKHISEILGISENNVAVRLNRAKKALMTLMSSK